MSVIPKQLIQNLSKTPWIKAESETKKSLCPKPYGPNCNFNKSTESQIILIAQLKSYWCGVAVFTLFKLSRKKGATAESLVNSFFIISNLHDFINQKCPVWEIIGSQPLYTFHMSAADS